MGERLLLRGGRVVDPAAGLDAERDLLLEDGRVAEVGQRLAARGAEVLDVSGQVVCPGFVDLRAHLREPGHEDQETLATGLAAAAAGGFTAVCAFADSEPCNDGAGVTRLLLERSAALGGPRLHPVGAFSRGRRGEELAELGELAGSGCVAFSDAPRSPASARLLRRGLEYARLFERPVVVQCEEASLAEGTVMNEGPVSGALGLRGVPAEAEALQAERDLQLAGLTGGRLHLSQLSTAGAVEALRRARSRGLRVSADASPHHLVLTDEAVRATGYDSATKLRPPLRAEADRQAVLAALRDGTIAAVASGHTPVTVDEKRCEFDAASFGLSALETAVAVCLDRLVRPGLLDLATLVARFSLGPARAFGLPGGSLEPGAPADVTVLDLERKRAVEPARFASLGRSTPFAGWSLRGWPVLTLVGGKVAHRAER